MVELHIKEDEVQKYLYFIVVFNALFPKVLEQSDIIIYISDTLNNNRIHCLTYWNFLNMYDHYGLNQVAR